MQPGAIGCIPENYLDNKADPGSYDGVNHPWAQLHGLASTAKPSSFGSWSMPIVVKVYAYPEFTPGQAFAALTFDSSLDPSNAPYSKFLLNAASLIGNLPQINLSDLKIIFDGAEYSQGNFKIIPPNGGTDTDWYLQRQSVTDSNGVSYWDARDVGTTVSLTIRGFSVKSTGNSKTKSLGIIVQADSKAYYVWSGSYRKYV